MLYSGCEETDGISSVVATHTSSKSSQKGQQSEIMGESLAPFVKWANISFTELVLISWSAKGNIFKSVKSYILPVHDCFIKLVASEVTPLQGKSKCHLKLLN